MLGARKKRSQTQNKTSFGNGFQNHNNENKFDNKKKKEEENVMLLESTICLFSNIGNDLFLSVESKKEEISNSKTSF